MSDNKEDHFLDLQDDELHDSVLRSKGFSRGEPVYRSDPRFSLDDVKQSLFAGTETPHPITVDLGDEQMQMVVSKLEASPVHIPGQRRRNRCPSWQAEGWVHGTYDDRCTAPTRIRCFLTVTFDTNEIVMVDAQLVPSEHLITLVYLDDNE